MNFQARKGCFLCGNLSHLAENCSSPSRLCYNCHEAGHESNACPEPRTAESKQCYGCGGIGHLQSDCPSLRAGFQQGGQKCYSCGLFGHIARSCPTAVPAVAGEPGVIGEAAAGGMDPLQAQGQAQGPPGGHQGNPGFRGGRGGFAGRGRGGAGFVNGAPRVVRCYKCGELNHLARSCTAVGDAVISAGPGAAGPGFVGAPRPPKTCYKCQVEGHIARECPTNEEQIAV